MADTLKIKQKASKRKLSTPPSNTQGTNDERSFTAQAPIAGQQQIAGPAAIKKRKKIAITRSATENNNNNNNGNDNNDNNDNNNNNNNNDNNNDNDNNNNNNNNDNNNDNNNNNNDNVIPHDVKPLGRQPTNRATSGRDDLKLELEKPITSPSRNTSAKQLSFPNHMLVFGATQAGKTKLIADILDNIESAYKFDSNRITHRKLVIISPMPRLEVAKHMSAKELWDIELYNIPKVNFDEDFEEHLKSHVFLPALLPNSINILLLDDVLTGQTNPNDIRALNKWFSYFRHLNVSIIATVHSYDLKFTTIIDQTGMIVAMHCMNTPSVIRAILSRHFYKGTANVYNEIRRIYLANLKAHDYICMNFSKRALSSKVFFITDTMFIPPNGIYLKQILKRL